MHYLKSKSKMDSYKKDYSRNKIKKTNKIYIEKIQRECSFLTYER